MKLGDYYRTHGETKHVRSVERALGDDWLDTVELAAISGKSPKYTRSALNYLFEEARADRRQEEMERPIFGQRWKWVWRRPTRRRYEPLPGEPKLDPVEPDEVMP